MTDITLRQHGTANVTIRVLVVLEAVVFLLAAVQHLGVSIPVGFAVLSEPPIFPAAIVEGSSGLLFVLTAFALFAERNWARTSALVSHVFALAGVMLGIFSLSVGAGPRTSTNDLYHMLMLVMIMPGLALIMAENTEKNQSLSIEFLHWLIRISGLVQVYLGLLFWIIQNDALIPFHILVGSLLVISLWVLAIQAAQAGVHIRFAVLAIVWGAIVVILGFTQTSLLPGPTHWIIEVLHLLIGLGAISQGESLAFRARRVKERAL